jgi:hypothetical protein
MSKTAEAAWLFVYALIGITALALVGSLLLGHPHAYNIIGKVWVHFIGFCALNGAYISFKMAVTGLEPDKPTMTHTPGTRLLAFLACTFVVALVWGGLWLVA